MNTIREFTFHGSTGASVLADSFLKWLETHSAAELGDRIVAYSWYVGDIFVSASIDIASQIWHVLPDHTGFICFEKDWKPDNCLLLDAYGKERMRLTVPWELTIQKDPRSASPPTSFANISGPYINPANEQPGQFGVTAWVEHAGKYYFELDFQAGKFLWGREIRD